MSRFFVDDPPVPVYEFESRDVVSDTAECVIWIKSKMDIETRGKVSSELVKMGSDNKTMEMHLGANQTALLLHNIVKWEGPGFDGVPCDPAHIRKIDPTEPLFEKVLEEIDRRNKKKVAPNPKSPIEPGFATNGSPGASPQNAGGVSLQLATGMSRSPLLRALDGRPNRSDSSTPTTLTNSLDD